MARFSPITALSLAVCVSALLPIGSISAASVPDHPLIPGFERFFSPPAAGQPSAEGGLLLLQEMNCTACHAAPEAWQEQLGKRGVISLTEVGDRLSVEALRTFISNPHEQKPGTLMPQLPLKEDQLAALATYLQSLKSKEAAKAFPQGNPHHGGELFHTIGCVACHAPDSPERYHPEEVAQGMPVEKPKLPSVPIRMAQDYPATLLAAFLQAPLKIRHAGRMPDFNLNDQQAADLAAYLQQSIPAKPVAQEAKPPAEGILAAGKKVFAAQRCIACHDTGGTKKDTFAAAKALTAVDPKNQNSCLSTSPSEAPHFALNDHQRASIQLALVALKQPPPSLTAAEKSDHFLVQMNCYACHEWNGKGGLEKARAQYFTVSEPTAHSLGEIGMLPPKLNHAGRKLTKAWLEKLLWGENGGVRPYMTARMPRFGKDNAESFIDPFAEACKSPTPVTIDTTGLLKHQRSENGRLLIGVGDKTSLGCVSCHGIKDRKSLGVPVVNLTHTAERLQPEYFKELLLNPQAVQPGTLMPPLFMGRKKADQEIEQLWTYLKEIDGARLPPGLLLEGDYELKPEATPNKKPIVFRTFLEGAGMQAVAVGFPQQAHLAFDTLEVHPALIWKGRFVDAMTTWEERAMTPAKPLGTDIITLSAHVPFAKLKSATDAWPDAPGNHQGYQFKGFRLNPAGIPSFLYQIDDLQVEEILTPVANGFKRHLTLRGKQPGWYFLGLGKDAKPTPVLLKNGTAQFEELISWPAP